jgi:hypothetical protein
MLDNLSKGSSMLSTSEGQLKGNEGWLAGTAIEPVWGIGLSFLMRLA